MDTRDLLMRRFPLLAVLALLMTTSTYGRVFWRWRGRDAPGRAIAQTGAQRIYRARVSINGVEADADIFWLPSPTLSAGLSLLQRTLPDMAFTHAGGNLVMGRDNDRDTLIVIQPSSVDPVTAFVIRTTGSAIPSVPDRHLLEHVPPFPGSQPVFYANDHHTGAKLAVASTREPPHAVINFYTASLAAAGWAPAFPQASSPSIQVFMRDREIVTLTAVSEDTPRQLTRITLLHKEPGSIRD